MGVWPLTELNCNIVDDEEEEVRELISVLSTELRSGYPPHLSFGGRKSKKEEQKKISLGVVLVCWAADRFITAHASQLGSSLEPSHANTSPRLLDWLPPPLLH
jgi:hypothetical protein